MATVLVTGATGFVASHVALALLERGYKVRGTARSPEKATRLREALGDYVGKPIDIELVPVDLTRDEGWAEAMHGVDYLQHVASPFPPTQPESADELIVPARDGALRALKAAKVAGVKRAVLTSSVAAIDQRMGRRLPGGAGRASLVAARSPGECSVLRSIQDDRRASGVGLRQRRGKGVGARRPQPNGGTGASDQ